MESKTLNPDCPCTNDCPRHGDCDACQANHKKGGSLTACQRIAKQKNESPEGANA
jgi:hypothetical protein